MSKQSPFYKFDVLEWLSGSIQLCTLEQKGLFQDICAMYWKNHKPVKIDNKFKARYTLLEVDISDLIVQLSYLEVLVYNEAEVTIPFLDELHDERLEFLENCSKGGRKSQKVKGQSSNKKEERRKKKEDIREKSLKSKPKKDEQEELELEVDKVDPDEKCLEVFDEFRKEYPGTKGGLDKMFERFKRNNDWKEVLPTLFEIILRQQDEMVLENDSHPDWNRQWKDLATWLNNRCWEDEPATHKSKKRTFNIALDEDKDKPKKVPVIAKDPSEMQPEI